MKCIIEWELNSVSLQNHLILPASCTINLSNSFQRAIDTNQVLMKPQRATFHLAV